jgi:regulator of protease activity HflC (stomatin/prohibitin superfamily)
MFSELLDVLQRVGGSLLPFVVVEQWQEGVILRFGKFRRTLCPGFHWMIPWVDKPVCVSAVTTTTALKAQSVVTKDGRVVTAEAVVRWRLQDVKAFVLDVWDADNVIIDSTQGAIADALRSVELSSPELHRRVLLESRRALVRFGVKVEAVTLTTLAPVKVLRLIGGHANPEPSSAAV